MARSQIASQLCMRGAGLVPHCRSATDDDQSEEGRSHLQLLGGAKCVPRNPGDGALRSDYCRCETAGLPFAHCRPTPDGEWAL